MLNHLKKRSVFLASQSPRRKELLESLNVKFEIRTSDTSETFPSTIPLGEVAPYLAKKKAQNFELESKDIYIAADTIVIAKGQILNKPKNEIEAEQMLLDLSNKKHKVYTGVCLKTTETTITFKECTEVTFNTLSMSEIRYYINHFHPLDKAGGYGIQDWIGRVGIRKINGCYYNVMGLPLSRLYSYLLKL